jgi:hypothetical protein
MKLFKQNEKLVIAYPLSNIEHTGPHTTQNPITTAYPAGNGFFEDLEAIATTWIPWK